MPVSLTLKRHGAYTNLDYIEGDVKLVITSSEHIENITVKVEGTTGWDTWADCIGISKTVIYAPRPGRERGKQKPIAEVHKVFRVTRVKSNPKVLYLQQVVWPDEKLRETKASSSSSSHFTLQAGSHSFPFKLRLPINNSCQPPPRAMSMQNYQFTNNSLTTVWHPITHVKQTLPPSLGGIDNAYIRYKHLWMEANSEDTLSKSLSIVPQSFLETFDI